MEIGAALTVYLLLAALILLVPGGKWSDMLIALVGVCFLVFLTVLSFMML